MLRISGASVIWSLKLEDLSFGGAIGVGANNALNRPLRKRKDVQYMRRRPSGGAKR